MKYALIKKTILLSYLAGLIFVGCSESDIEIGTVSLRIIDTSYSMGKELALEIEDYSEVIVSIKRIELTDEDTVVILEDYTSNPVRINLLDLGVAGIVLVDNTELPLGIYNKIRMILDAPEEQNQAPVNPASFLTMEGDVTEYPLFIPSGAQTGLKINLTPPIELIDDSSFEITLDFNSENTIHKTGQNNRYIIRPTSMSATVTDNS
jgi:hypothetical protein